LHSGTSLKKCDFLARRPGVPKTGDKCPLVDGSVCLIGTAFCCKEGCEPAIRCDCKSGSFVCEANTIADPCLPEMANIAAKTAPPRGHYTKFPSASPVKL
jgi:hypothetical protein